MKERMIEEGQHDWNTIVTLGDNEEQNDFEIQCAIQRAAGRIHSMSIRNGQFLLCASPLAMEWMKRQATERIYRNRFYCVPIGEYEPDGMYNDCIVLIRRGEFMRMWIEEKDNPQGVELFIPEIKRRPAASREKDFVYTIYLERKK